MNRGLAVLRVMWNLGRKGVLPLKGGMPGENPVSELAFEPPHDKRDRVDRVFSAEEISRLLDTAPEWLQPVILLAYQTGMRRGEIVCLRWEQVDVKRGVIRLRSGKTKTDEGRVIPMPASFKGLLATLPWGLGQAAVFLNSETGQPYTPRRYRWPFSVTVGE